jgi:hypothetical protein
MSRTPSGAALTLIFKEVENGFHLEVSSGPGKSKLFTGSREGLKLVRDGLKSRLDDVKEAVMRNAREDAFVEFGSALDEAFAGLRDESLDLLGQMAGQVPEEITALALRLQRAITAPRPHGHPPVINVIAPQDLWVPVDLLAPHAVENVRIRNPRQLRRACTRVLGFAAIVRRVIARPAGARALGLTDDRELIAPFGLPLVFFYDATLDAARLEAETLSQFAPKLALTGPWPDRNLAADEDIVKAFVRHLMRAEAKDRSIAQIQHFACHCDTRSDDVREHALRLAALNGSPTDVSIAQIGRERTAMATDAAFADTAGVSDDPPPLPLIFLNACSTSTIDFRAAASFPELFLSAGKRGFIGTETDIPDAFAARFSARFYDELLLGGRSVGRALNEAKWRMVNERQNPLGILYTMYADPDLHVSFPARGGGAR